MQVPQILQQLGRNQGQGLSQMMGQIKQAKAMMAAMGGQQIDVNRILQQNPKVQQLISTYGSVDGAIQAVCQQKGIDYHEFMDALK